MDLLPIATQSAVQTIFVTTTGAEKALTLCGLSFIVLFTVIGLVFVVISFVKGIRK